MKIYSIVYDVYVNAVNDDDELQVMMLMIQVLILKNLLNELTMYLNFDNVLRINSDVVMDIEEQPIIDHHHRHRRHHHHHHQHYHL
jgi:hypothetical protein